MTSISTVDFDSPLWPDDSSLPVVSPSTTIQANDGTDRDAQIADLAGTTSGVNQLQSLASASSTLPAPALPSVQQQSQAQQSAAQPPLKLDFYADGDDAE